MTAVEIERLVIEALERVNLSRPPDAQIAVSPRAAIFGAEGALESLGLVSLLIDLEEALQDRGYDINLSDARAMSQTASPFRDVPALVAYISAAVGDKM